MISLPVHKLYTSRSVEFYGVTPALFASGTRVIQSNTTAGAIQVLFGIRSGNGKRIVIDRNWVLIQARAELTGTRLCYIATASCLAIVPAATVPLWNYTFLSFSIERDCCNTAE